MNENAGTPLHAPSLVECYAHTDLQWRLAQVPDSAMCRGTFMNNLDDHTGVLGRPLQRAYREYFQLYKFSPFKFYPLRDYLTRIVMVAQMQYGGPEIYRGIFEIQSAAYPAWKRTLIGATVFAVLGTNMESVLKALEKGYAGAHFVNYARFSYTRIRPDLFTTRFNTEYLYIEHAMRGALAGVAETCNVKAEFDVRMSGPFDGEIDIRLV